MDTRATQFLGHVDTFTQRIANLETDRWGGPSSCEGWSTKGVLDHIIDTQHDVFDSRGLELGPRPKGASHEVWAAHTAAMKSTVTDEEALLATYDSFFGPTTLADTLLSFYRSNLIIHTWDIQWAAGNDLKLSNTELVFLETCIPSWGDVFYQNGVCKRPVEAPDDTDRQTRILVLTGRRC